MPSPTLGEIRLFAFNRAPTDWLLCDGSAREINEYPELFALISTTYGGDGGQTFGLPDLRGRVPVHQGQGRSDAGNLSNRSLGAKGGSETVALKVAHMPAHTHSFSVSRDIADGTKPEKSLLGSPVGDRMYVAPGNIGTAASASTDDTTTSISGESAPHENTMPTLTLSYCICAQGYFPSQS